MSRKSFLIVQKVYEVLGQSPNILAYVKFPGESIHVFKIEVNKSETIYPWKIPQIALAIHSPFVPVHPLWEGIPLKQGHDYIINLRLEEEHLLPFPYDTNCTDYDALWRRNNKSGPRSQEATLLYYINAEIKKILSSLLLIHLMNCITDVSALVRDDLSDDKSDVIIVQIRAPDPQVIIKSHVPLYRIPELGYYASDSKTEVVKALRKLYIGTNIPDKFWNIKNGLPNTNNDFKTIYVFDTRRDVYVTCYAHNLHLNTSSAPETMNTNVKFPGEFIHAFKIDVNKSENIYLWKIPQIFLAIHSPFVPVHPLWEGIPLKQGHNYIINLRLEEEYLLPYPYHTNCTDYDALWRSNNKAGPRSQEMCKYWCAWTLSKACSPHEPGIKMLEKPIRLCEDNEFGNPEVDIDLIVRKSKCNPECRKLKYSYTIAENKFDEIWEEEYFPALSISHQLRGLDVMRRSNNKTGPRSQEVSFLYYIKAEW
ncbi:hypothetical protein HNY73_015179 [Argiope bruennichi]|uniref:Uncharacterized protein n=1 Tax=Argiope bruennichi TaxID=94029 RepID=A0A8T0ESP0_ARGBR|nr:hypothetical protein HNY73_015179 [Argiope bruennichi]